MKLRIAKKIIKAAVADNEFPKLDLWRKALDRTGEQGFHQIAKKALEQKFLRGWTRTA